MPPALHQRRHHVQRRHGEHGIDEQRVRGLQPLLAPERVESLHPARDADRGQQRHQREHHETARRVVTDVAAITPRRGSREMRQRGARARHEVGEPRVRTADKAPDHTHDERARHRVAHVTVRCLAGFEQQIVREHARHDRPVKNAHDGVPHADGTRLRVTYGSGGRDQRFARMRGEHG
jgi:hypothetical protein